jgi:hypothetical protein
MLNPYINYPFNEEAMLRQANFSRACKALGVHSTKIYYTTRELSDRTYEMPTLRLLSSSEDHIFDNGTGGGASWLQEHLQSNYHLRWSTGLADGEIDNAIADTRLSRWINYYIQGLQWLTAQDHAGPDSKIDGLYLDELSFDRSTMQRMRKAVDQHRSGALFDLHSCNKYSCGVPQAPHACSALIYMAHFAFLDSLWFGEGFSPNYPPDQWLVEMSGIPFGMHAEQLSSPNLPRGMVFAEGARPAPALWRAWDSLKLTAPGVRLVGWWDANPIVHSSDSVDCPATAYIRPGINNGIVIAVASWKASGTITVVLDIDWKVVGFAPTEAVVSAAAIANYQPNATLPVSSAGTITVSVAAAGGWLLDVSKRT